MTCTTPPVGGGDMLRRPLPASVTLRALLEALREDPAWRARAEAGLLDLAARLSKRNEAVPQGMPLTVVRFVQSARQLADAVANNHVSANNRSQANRLALGGRAVQEAVDAWTDEGRVEPPMPPARGTT